MPESLPAFQFECIVPGQSLAFKGKCEESGVKPSIPGKGSPWSAGVVPAAGEGVLRAGIRCRAVRREDRGASIVVCTVDSCT